MSRKSRKGPDAVDIAIGARVRALRCAAHLNQTELGAALGVSFQQIQKYEKGVSRLSGGNLHKAAKALGTSVARLVSDGASDTTSVGPDIVMRMLGTSMGRQLAEVFLEIDNREDRIALLRVAQAMAHPALSTD